MSSQLLSIIVGVSSLLGLLSLLAYLFLHIRTRSAERSVRSIVEGEGLFNSGQIISVLEKFQDDTARLEALKALANIDIRKAEQVLEKVKDNVDIEKLSSEAQSTSIRHLIIGAALFFTIAVIGLFYSLFHPSDITEDLPPSDIISSNEDSAYEHVTDNLLIKLHDSIASRIRFVTWVNKDFVVGLVNPSEILRLNESGKSVGDPVKLTGEPRSVDVRGNMLVVGQSFPGLIEIFDSETLESIKQFEIPDIERKEQVWSGAPSTEPASIAVGKDNVWVNTEGNGVPIIYHLNTVNGEWTVPDFEGLGHDNQGWVLSYAWRKFFAVTSETIPSSIYELTKSNVLVFAGHDNESISCTPAIWEGTVGDITIISCDDKLIEVNVSDRLKVVKNWGDLPKSYAGGWSHYDITSSGNNFIVARTDYNQDPWYPLVTQVTELKASGEFKTLLELEDVELVDISASKDTVLVALKGTDNRYQAIRIIK